MELNGPAKKKRKGSHSEIFHIYQGPLVSKLCMLRNSENIVKSENMKLYKDLIVLSPKADMTLSPKADTTFEERYSVFVPDHNIRIPKAPAFRSFAQTDIDTFLDRNKQPKTRIPKYLQKLSIEDMKVSKERLTKSTLTNDFKNKLTCPQKMVLPDIKTCPRINSSKTENSDISSMKATKD